MGSVRRGGWGVERMDERVPAVIKGDRDGLFLVIDPEAEWADVTEAIRKRLETSPRFFRGASVRIEENGREVEPHQRAEIAQLLSEFQVEFQGVTPTRTPEARAPEPPRKEHPPADEADMDEQDIANEQTLLIRRTLRSGQSITFDGNVVIQGDVNPGAHVVCTGDILVLGALRGLAHAGASGNEKAVVVAFRLEPTQLRIAGHISRAPDGELSRPGGPELARVRDSMIQVEAYSP